MGVDGRVPAAGGQAGVEEFPEEDKFFHRALYDRIGNRLLIQLVDTFWLVARRMRERAELAGETNLARSWEEHRRIVEALEHGDAAAAGAAMHQHFAGVSARIGCAGRPDMSTKPDTSTKAD